MINRNSIEAVNGSTFSSSFVKPLYDSYCFSKIPGTIMNLLTKSGHSSLPEDVFSGLPKEYDKIVLFLVDAFGWVFFEKYCNEYPVLREIINNGTVSKLTSQFPSTTAAHVTTIHTSLPVNKSGIYEWFYYEPKVDGVIAPLLFSMAGDRDLETLGKYQVNPHEIYPCKNSLYRYLKGMGIESYPFHNSGINHSTYSSIMLDSANVQGYYTISEGLVNLSRIIHDTKGKAYFYFYMSEIDTMGHHYGPESRQFEAEMNSFFTGLEKIFFKSLSGKLKNTLLLITADHGQTCFDIDRAIYLNLSCEKVKKYLKKNKKGNYMVPCGSYRDMFLHVNDGYTDECIKYLKESLQGTAEVYRVRDLINNGMFGTGSPSEEFLKRVGDIVILPYKGEGVWWYEKGKFEVHLPGMHGGLTKEELEIPFLAYPFI